MFHLSAACYGLVSSCVSLVCRVLYEGKEQLKQGWYVIETTPYSRSASLTSGGGPVAHRVFLTYRRALDTQGLHTLGITDIGLLLPSKGEVAPHTFCRVDKNLNTSMVSPRRRGLFPHHNHQVFLSWHSLLLINILVSSGVRPCLCATRERWLKLMPWSTNPVSICALLALIFAAWLKIPSHADPSLPLLTAF